MRVAILLNRTSAGIRAVAKKAIALGHDLSRGNFSDAGNLLLPEYDSFARLLDEKPLFLGLDEDPSLAKIRECDLLIWEWGWTADPARRLLQIRDKVEIPTLVFPGPLDRFWREVSPEDIPLHVEAGKRTHLVGVMSSDLIQFYSDLLPHARVFHMPVPVDVDRIAALAGRGDPSDSAFIMLTAPTLFAGIASQLPITTMLAFRSVVKSRPAVRGIAYAYSEEEVNQCSSILGSYGLGSVVSVERYARPLQRFVLQANKCRAGLFLSNGQIQGRMAMVCACIGIPMVVSDHIEAHRQLFPETLAAWYETGRAGRLLERLLDDSVFAKAVIRIARERVEVYSPQNVRDSILRELKVLMESSPVTDKVG